MASGKTESGSTMPQGMVDTSKFKAAGPWAVARAGLGDTNAWMTMFGLHFKYGIEEKYAADFKSFKVTACFWNPVQQITDIEGLVAQKPNLLFVDRPAKRRWWGGGRDLLTAASPWSWPPPA